MKSGIKQLIKKMGYEKSEDFYYLDGIPYNNYSKYYQVMLKELQPTAVYFVHNKPFVCFFDFDNCVDVNVLKWRIWNAQIPIAICIEEGLISIYDGKSLNLKQMSPECIKSISAFSDDRVPFSYFDIKSESLWNNYIGVGRKKNTLNKILLKNISYITKKLKDDYNVAFANKLILRMIFIRYLIDRGIDIEYSGFGKNVVESRNRLITLCGSYRDIYDLFYHLKKKFNGNLFEVDRLEKDIPIPEQALNLVGRFLSGKEIMDNGQLAFFDLYDFKIIPVELISNIYEILLGDDVQKKDKAFYTPSYLAEYIVEQEVKSKGSYGKILDPACGSGIFLVNYFRILVEKYDENKMLSDSELISLLSENIYGVDKNPDAINVAVFSLYLTILDYKDPKTLKNFKLPNLINNNLFCADFFSGEVDLLKEMDYDYIIGNPPWGRTEKNALHVQYCKEKKLPQQNEEISRSFLYRVKEFSNVQTRNCFILPSKIFYNQEKVAKQCREYILCNMKINTILEMSSVVSGLFENALSPALVFSFSYIEEQNYDGLIKHIALKPSWIFTLFQIIMIEHYDLKYIKQRMLLQYDWLWKLLVYGNTGDLENVIYLKSNFITLREVIEKEIPQLDKGTGIQYNNGKYPTGNLMGRPLFVPKKNIDHFWINESKECFVEIKKDKIHRTRKEQLFQAPYCLLTKGVDPHNYRMRAVCCETKDFVYPETIYGIKSNAEQIDLLYLFAGLFNSSLYAYYNLMVGASVGIDRRQRFVDDVLDFPFPKENIEKIIKCSKELHELNKQIFIAEGVVEDKMQELDSCVLQAFGLSENVYIDFALNVTIPMIVNHGKNVIKNANEEDYFLYAKTFIQYFSPIYESVGKYVKIQFFIDAKQEYTLFELLITDEKPDENIQIIYNNLSQGFKDLMLQQYNDIFYSQRDIFYFGENSISIVKKASCRNWHLAVAHMDLAEISNSILMGEEDYA